MIFCRKFISQSVEFPLQIDHSRSTSSVRSAFGALEDQNHPCAEGVHLCRLREAVQRAPDGTQIDQKWEATRWEWDPALGQKKVGSPHAIQNRRIIAMVEAIRSYGTALSSQLAKKEREVETWCMKRARKLWYLVEICFAHVNVAICSVSGRDAKAEESPKSLDQLLLGDGFGRTLWSGVRGLEQNPPDRELESGDGAGHDEV